MNTFWLKLAGGIVVALVLLIVGASFFSSKDTSPEPADDTSSESLVEKVTETKSFAKQVEEDKEKFAVQPPPQPKQAPEPSSQTSEPRKPTAPAPVEPKVIYVKPLDEIDSIQAEKLLSAAVPGRSMARLRVGYNLTVQNCRQILNDYPDTWFAYQAKRVLADLPERLRPNYKLTDDLLDTSMFLQQRPGTQPMKL
jgi:hypothetical protein